MNKYIVIAIFGKSGAGKTFIQSYLCSTNHRSTNKIISCTTRPKRDLETNNFAYHFLTEEDFKQQVKENHFLETTEFNNWYYGTRYDDLKQDKINIGVFNIEGIQALKNNPNIELYTVEAVCSDKTRLQRCLARELHPDCQEICRRYLSELNIEHIQADYIINTDTNWQYEDTVSTLIDQLWTKLTNSN